MARKPECSETGREEAEGWSWWLLTHTRTAWISCPARSVVLPLGPLDTKGSMDSQNCSSLSELSIPGADESSTSSSTGVMPVTCAPFTSKTTSGNSFRRVIHKDLAEKFGHINSHPS